MKLNRNNLLFSILLFGLIINLLIIDNLNFFYIRAILAFLFIILVPGLLVMLILRIREVGFWEYLVYTVGLSIAFIMFAGLAVNWILPWLHITDKPLALAPILICFDLFLLIMGFFAYRRNADLYRLIQFPEFDWINRIFLIVPMLFPVMSVLGAFILNNNGPNTLTMIMLGGIAVYVFCIVLFRKRLNENVYPWAIWMIGLSLLLMFSMRSWHIIGFDINQEMKVTKLVLLNNHWDIDLFRDAYNTCLSLAILPPVLDLFLDIKIDFVFKLIIQILFSFLPVILYLIYKKVINRKIIAFLSCFFFISQIFFIEQIPAIIRQEIAYLFFSLFFLLLFSNETKFKNILLIIFGISVIVSHYATSYIFLFSLIVVSLFVVANKKTPLIKNRIEKIRSLFPLAIFLILFLFGFLWTFQITPTSSGLSGAIQNTYSKLGEIFTSESKSEIIQSLTFNRIDYSNIFQNYSNEIPVQYQNNSNINLLNGTSSINYIPFVSKKISNYGIFNAFNQINLIIASYFKLLIFLGIVICIIFIKDFKRKDYFIYSAVFFLITLLIAILPYVSLYYNLERIFLQTLIFLSLTTIYSGHKLFVLITKKDNVSIIIISIFIIIFLLSSSLLVPFVFLGGKETSLIFGNQGSDFDKFYMSNADVKSLEWINLIHKNSAIFYFDRYAKLKVLSILPAFSPTIFSDINPKTIDKSAYVFASASNQRGVSTISYAGVLFNIEFPNRFLNDNKNKIYNNGGSEIFK